jgi:micrococcal nuclease
MVLKTAYCMILMTLLSVADGSAADSFTGVIQKIIDGDSLLIATPTTIMEVRLYGIDCPEYRQPYSRAAKKYVKARFFGSRVRVHSYYDDPYGRKISMVFIGDKMLNEELVEAGLAWVHPAYCRKPICREWKEKEVRARQEKRGLWQEHNAMPPWQWKRIKKLNRGR